MNRFEWERQAYAQRFNGEALRVLWAYASHADSETLVTFPGIREVAQQTGISVEKVQRYRKELIGADWLVETEEKTSRGQAKLRLAVGQDVVPGYLGEKRAVRKASQANLIPAAKQKKSAGLLDFPDTSRLESPESTCLESPDTQGLDFPDVTTNTNNKDRTTMDNQTTTTPAAAHAGTEDDSLVRGIGDTSSNLIDTPDSYEYLGSLNLEDFEDFSLTREVLAVDVFANSQGVKTVPQSQSETDEFDGYVADFRTRNHLTDEQAAEARKLYESHTDLFGIVRGPRKASEAFKRVLVAAMGDW